MSFLNWVLHFIMYILCKYVGMYSFTFLLIYSLFIYHESTNTLVTLCLVDSLHHQLTKG